MKAKKIEISAEEAEALLGRVKNGALGQDDYEIIKGLVDTLMLLNQAVTEKTTSIKRLLQIIFGHKTEKKKKSSEKKTGKRREKKKKGHGRNGADEYTGAEKVTITHDSLQPCDPCPACDDGKLYRQPAPCVLVRVKCSSPLQATVY